MIIKKKNSTDESNEVEIEAFTHEGRGLAHVDGKAVFVAGALPGERVKLRYCRKMRRYDEAIASEILHPAPARVEPKCPHFGVCGGCSLQHLSLDAQIQHKQASVINVLSRIGQVAPQTWLTPLTAQPWGYRSKARLGVRYVAKKGRVLLGFREYGSSFLADLTRCEILHPTIGEQFNIIAAALNELSIREQIPQIEVAMGDPPAVLVVRVLAPPTAADCERLLALAQETKLKFYLQTGGVETISPLPGQALDLQYSLPEYKLNFRFQPSDFTQINLEINRLMINQALNLLAIQSYERVLDLFCGIGNFSLPLALQAESVIGVEGNFDLVKRAEANAIYNSVLNTKFYFTDLDKNLSQQPWLQEKYALALIDPPRSGALSVLSLLPSLGIKRILYVSCYPTTLARDAARLVHDLNYKFLAAEVIDMFPHTSHIETLALFEHS